MIATVQQAFDVVGWLLLGGAFATFLACSFEEWRTRRQSKRLIRELEHFNAALKRAIERKQAQ